MSRQIWLAVLLAACTSKSPEQRDTPTPPPGSGEKIKVPTGNEAASKGAPGGTVGGAPVTDDPKMHLQPDEGTLTIDKAEGKAGAELTSKLVVAPATGRHLSTEYPIQLTLDPPPDGVTLAKQKLTAGGMSKSQGDAETFSETQLAFAVKATAAKAGAYEIKGWFKFGVCDKDSCHPKKQPITITVAAN